MIQAGGGRLRPFRILIFSIFDFHFTPEAAAELISLPEAAGDPKQWYGLLPPNRHQSAKLVSDTTSKRKGGHELDCPILVKPNRKWACTILS